MTNNPNPQQNKPSSSTSSSFGQPSTGRSDTNPVSRQDTGRTSGETQQFGGIRGGVESEKSASRASSSSEIERCLNAIEDNVRKLRDALSASSSSQASMGRSESTESSRSASSSYASGSEERGNTNQPGRSASR